MLPNSHCIQVILIYLNNEGQQGWEVPSHLPETFNSDENAPPPNVKMEKYLKPV